MEETGPVEVESPEDGDNPSRAWIPIAAIFVALCGGVAWLLLGSDAGDAFVYSKSVAEVAPDPGSFEGRELRVEGDLRQGSIRFREDPCEWRFVLVKGEHEMPVSFPQCVVPDTFRDGMGISVVVQGKINSDGSFLANQVIPRCPSKYEMQQHEEAGGAAPHGELSPPLSEG